jgi:hypothetical protein
MGPPADRNAVRLSMLDWNGLELEDAIVERGLCGAMVRSQEVWAATQQGQVLAAQPLVEVLRIGDSPAEPMPKSGSQPLIGHPRPGPHTHLAGPELLWALVLQADVFTQSFRSGALGRLGFGSLDLVRARPGIIYTAINAYGHEGPWKTRGGWEQLAQTVTGVAHPYRTEGEAPSFIPAPSPTMRLASLGRWEP